MASRLLGFREGVLDCFTISIAGAVVGVLFGLTAQAKGMSIGMVLAMSAGVFAGAAQLVALELWQSEALPIYAILAITLTISLRFLLMGIGLRQRFGDAPARMVYPALFFLIDENWALTVQSKAKRGGVFFLRYFLGAGMVFYLFWVLGSLSGYAFSSSIRGIEALEPGVHFAFATLFLCLLVGSVKSTKHLLPMVIAGIVALLAQDYTPDGMHITLGALLGSVAGAFLYGS